MNKFLEKIFETKKFLNRNQEIIAVHSETPREQCLFLEKIISDNGFKKSIEIGFAYGTSTLAITEAISKNSGLHFVIDKFQLDDWGGNGLDLIEQAGLSKNLEFCDKYCYEILPELLKKERYFDFAYIDSTKQLDWILVDFFYIDKLLEINGIIVFDDAGFPGIRKILRYISQYPNYKIYAVFPKNYKYSRKRKLLNLLKYLPKSNLYIKDEILNTDFNLKINSGCIAMQKIDHDKRNWDWHVNF